MSEEREDQLTHFDAAGAARMVDVSRKPETPRMARARARLKMAPATLARIEAGEIGKGDVLGVARLGGIAGAKQASLSIPLCHPVRLTAVDVAFEIARELPGVIVEATVEAVDRTGPEMEAMCAASAAALTIYDMCKAMDRGMEVVELRLVEKRGGKSGHWQAPAAAEVREP
ncbi:cyclic pyranopterin monophosphate synthase MoaC [Pseudenhygromyxa sp. WMMC2535]|uniref:cyclic pyranopterin monophosphate synthase MoaC n=1 Tax=Pseudenhygromyxa sp. WMMC2535 TaxID=2712867 RepID=UPI001553620E|nr:cyclic pyranopterin monophosphate synthase MoaC [Pseudenhygromyxa sp. WMMC2535]NVB37922.1 cyclic pyranopterin monophosphate synthase MoaC [Pseudenhygromyxa sp. WMMC2535]